MTDKYKPGDIVEMPSYRDANGELQTGAPMTHLDALQVPTGPYTSMGKEVLSDGRHFADAVTPDVAARIARALNNLEPGA